MKKHKQISSQYAARLLLASYILIMLLLQLFTFEKFPEILAVAGVMSPWNYIGAVKLVILELLAVPYLIDLRLPDVPRLASKVSGLLALGLATAFEVLGFINGQTLIFGATLDLPSGSWTLYLLAALWVLMIWSLMPKLKLISRKA